MSEFTVFGAGAMGTAMSHLLACNGHDVFMWARRKEIADQINRKRENAEYMPTLILPENVRATTSLEECATTARRMIIAIPSHAVNELCTKLSKHVSSNAYWLSVVKGMDTRTKCTISELLHNKISVKKDRVATLSGPNFAIEIVNKIPTVAVIGSQCNSTASLFKRSLTNNYFLITTTNDLSGVEISGILKNIGAIALGIVDGLNFGDNTRGAIFPIFIKEAFEIGTKIFGAEQYTLLGPAFLGDIITTAFSDKSRNRVLGLIASKRITNLPIHTFVAEGRNNAEIIRSLAKSRKIKIPITEFVYSVLNGTKPFIAFDSMWKQIRELTTL